MRKAISIYGDKEYITNVGKDYVNFKFPDGSYDRLKARKTDLQDILEWYKGEMEFYERMRRELSDEYNKKKESFKNSHHYYDDEEIKQACMKDRFADIDMKISNRIYIEEHNKIVGILETSMKTYDKYDSAARMVRQIMSALNAM